MSAFGRLLRASGHADAADYYDLMFDDAGGDGLIRRSLWCDADDAPELARELGGSVTFRYADEDGCDVDFVEGESEDCGESEVLSAVSETWGDELADAVREIGVGGSCEALGTDGLAVAAGTAERVGHAVSEAVAAKVAGRVALALMDSLADDAYAWTLPYVPPEPPDYTHAYGAYDDEDWRYDGE